MRRRLPVEDDVGVPARLLRYRYEDWADETEPLSETWVLQGREPAMFYAIRAFKRFVAAGSAYRAERAISRERWEALQRSVGVGVVVDPAPGRRGLRRG